jgi:hypothetical protein
MSDCIAATFRLPADQEHQLRREINELFKRRDESLHGYTEARPPQAHPLGLQTGAEMAVFNALECRRYLGTALNVLSLRDEPPSPANRWVSRWVTDRSAFHLQVVRPIREAFNSAST